MMSQDSKPYKRIRAQDIQELKGWALPQVGSTPAVALQRKPKESVQVVEEEIAAEKITVAELEAIRESARLEGLAAGLEEGRAEGRKEGKEAGFARGQKQGHQEGFASGQSEVNRLQSMLQEMVSELEAPLKQSTAEIESLLLDLVVDLAESVVGFELSERKDLLASSIKSALEQLPESSGAVTIRINPADGEHIKAALSDVSDNCEVVDDPAITAGGYKMQTLNTLVRHEVEARFEHVAQQLLESLKLQDETDESST